MLARFEPRFAIAHLEDVAPDGDGVGTPEFGTGVFPQRPYLDFLRTARPDLPLILEHLPMDHVRRATERLLHFCSIVTDLCSLRAELRAESRYFLASLDEAIYDPQRRVRSRTSRRRRLR